jgi:hypothetical protein
MLRKLWNDDRGAVFATEIVLVATILVIGIVAGLKAISLAVNDELSELAGGVGSISQSYNYCGVIGACAVTRGSAFSDTAETFSVSCFASFDAAAPAAFTCP